MTDEERKAKNRERQSRYRMAHEADPSWREHRNRLARRRYIQARGSKAGSFTVAESLEIKRVNSSPDTLRRRESRAELTRLRLCVMEHYKTLLFDSNPCTRFKGIAWFREIMGIRNPYAHLEVPTPDLTEQILDSPTPLHWRFHATDLLKNSHD